MADIFGQIYGWFQSLFGQDLSYYLWGYDPATEGYTNPNIYNHVGLIAIIVAMVLVLVPKWPYWAFGRLWYRRVEIC